MNSNSMMALINKIVSIYGKFDDDDETTRSSGNIYSKAYRFYRYFNTNLTIMVVVADMFNSNNYLIGSSVFCYYMEPIMKEEVEAALRRKQSDNFDL